MSFAVNLTGGGDQRKRRDLDFYPTPPLATHALMQFLNIPTTLIWEPACGDFAMSNVIEKYGHTVISTDIKYGDDFLDTPSKYDFGAIITNPPFCDSEAFIRKAIHEAPIVCMLLKSQYWHAQKRLDLFRKHPPAWVLPLAWRLNFMEGIPGKTAPTMECFWTVWKEGEADTRYRVLERPIIHPNGENQ